MTYASVAGRIVGSGLGHDYAGGGDDAEEYRLRSGQRNSCAQYRFVRTFASDSSFEVEAFQGTFPNDQPQGPQIVVAVQHSL